MRRTGPPRESAAVGGAQPVISILGEDVTVDAGYLAEKLGLSADRLRMEMQRRIVYGVVERGVGEDAGRLRLTFRYRARSWTLIVEPDGTLHETTLVGLAPEPGSPPE